MKRLMYLSVSLLCLALATLIGFHIGQGKAEAQSGSMTFSPVVTAGFRSVLLVNGEVWTIFPAGGGWSQEVTIPIPASEVAYLLESQPDYITIIDRSGNGWVRFNGQWTNYGPPPAAVSIQPSTWSEIKAKFAPPK